MESSCYLLRLALSDSDWIVSDVLRGWWSGLCTQDRTTFRPCVRGRDEDDEHQPVEVGFFFHTCWVNGNARMVAWVSLMNSKIMNKANYAYPNSIIFTGSANSYSYVDSAAA